MMTKKISVSVLVVILILVIASLYVSRRVFAPTIPENAEELSVVDIARVDINTVVETNLVWVPGEFNSVVAASSYIVRNNDTEYTYHQETRLHSYNLETGEITEMHNLWAYGVSIGNHRALFWSADGRYIVTGPGGVVDLEARQGYWLEPPPGFAEITSVYGIAADGRYIFLGANPETGTGQRFFFDVEEKSFRPFEMQAGVFYAERWNSRALSPNGEWIAVTTADPDYYEEKMELPLEPVPVALSLLRSDGSEARIIARDIQGRIDEVVFSPDGTKIAWLVYDIEERRQRLYLANIDGSGMHEIFNNFGLPDEYVVASNLVWSPDGTRIVFHGYPNKDYVYPFWVLTLGSGEGTTMEP